MVNEGVESAKGITAVGRRVIVVGGMALANGQKIDAKDETQTDTGSISVNKRVVSAEMARLNETPKDKPYTPD